MGSISHLRSSAAAILPITDNIYMQDIPITDIVVDAKEGMVSFEGEANITINKDHEKYHDCVVVNFTLTPHGKAGDGYQRHPGEPARQTWFDEKVLYSDDGFDDHVARVIEVALITSGPFAGKYAAMDGGGTWMLRIKNGEKKVMCRVHLGLSRDRQADLFAKFDSLRLRLRNWQIFLAKLRARDPEAQSIAAAIEPMHVDGKGRGALQNVGSLMRIHAFKGASYGPRLLSRVCKIVANAERWGGYKGTGEWTGVGNISPLPFLGVTLLADALTSKDDLMIRKAITTFEYRTKGKTLRGHQAMVAKLKDNQKGRRSAARALLAAEYLAKNFASIMGYSSPETDALVNRINTGDLYAKLHSEGSVPTPRSTPVGKAA